MKNANPFSVNSYLGPEYFCDRANESKRICTNVNNGINTTILSIRRLGKTGLIHHTFQQLSKQKNTTCIYIDIYATQNLTEFTNAFATSVYRAFPDRNAIGKKFKEFIIGLRPIISFDPLTSNPEVKFEFIQSKQTEQSLLSIFRFLENQNHKIVIAFDEFQQINNYPEKNIEAILRTEIQKLKNIQFIFCGSSMHLLAEMFNNSKRPFFASTDSLHLQAIEENEYAYFIQKHFRNAKRIIDQKAIDFILRWTRVHTYYTQLVCNKLYALNENIINTETVLLTCSNILKDHESVFFQYRNLLTDNQWQLLKAIATEDKVYQPTSKKMIGTYKLGTSANIKRALESLLAKEMIYKENDEVGFYYRVYDCFLAHWLAKL